MLTVCAAAAACASPGLGTTPAAFVGPAALAAWAGETPAERLEGVASEPVVRVRVGKGLSEARIESARAADSGAPTPGRARVVVGERDPGLVVETPVFVKWEPAGWRIIDGRGACYRRDAEASAVRVQSARAARSVLKMGLTTLVLEAPAPDGSPLLVLGDRALEGELVVRPRGGVVDVIEEVALEAYLPGVVAGELYGHWPMATHAAQAVAARSYALSQIVRARAAGKAWDLEGGASDQAYAGAESSRAARQSVRGTRGIVLAYQGRVLRAYYSASSGGRTAAAGTLWGGAMNTAPPLQAEQVDEYAAGAPMYRWSVTRDRADLAARLRAWGEREGHPVRLLEDLRDVQVASRSRVNKPVRYAVRDAGGAEFILSAEQMRVACNFGAAPGLGVLNDEQWVRSGDVEMAIEGERVLIDGRGFGHGVGLSQWSAKVMGERGISWRAILAKFYPGAQVVRAY